MCVRACVRDCIYSLAPRAATKHLQRNESDANGHRSQISKTVLYHCKHMETGGYSDTVQLYCDYGPVNGDYTATQLICPTERQLVLVNTCYNGVQ